MYAEPVKPLRTRTATKKRAREKVQLQEAQIRARLLVGKLLLLPHNRTNP